MSDIIVVTEVRTERDGRYHVEFTLNGVEGSTSFDDPDRLREVESPSPIHNPQDAARLVLSWWRARDPELDPVNIVGKRLQVDLASLTPILQLDL